MRRIGETRGRGSRTQCGFVGRLVAALSIALGASCASAPFRGDTGIRPFGFDLFDVHCPSGLRVVVERTPGSPIVGVTALVGVGSRQDPPGHEGLAHVVEHLAFRSHAPDQATAWTRLFDLGATFNGHTDFDTTTYESFAPATNLRGLMQLESQRLLQPIAGLDDRTFAVEVEVVRNELRGSFETDASGAGFLGIEQAVFPASHPYARPIIGTHDSLSRLSLDDARQFAAAHYRPEDMTLVVAGDIDLAHADQLMREMLPAALYGDPAHPRPMAPAGSRRPPSTPPPAPPTKPSSLPHMTAAVRTPEIWIAWTAPGGYGDQRFVGDLWASLGTGLFSIGQFDDPDIAQVDVFSVPRPMATTVIFRARLTQGAHPEESLTKIMKALPWNGDDDLYLDSYIRSLKTWALRSLAFSAEDISDRSLERVAYAHFTGSLGYYREAIAAVQAITAGQARDFATRYLTADRARAILVEPLAAQRLKAAGERSRSRPEAPDVKHPPLSPPTMASLAAVKHMSEMRRFTLPTGLEVLIIPRPGAPVVKAALGVHGGLATAPPGLGDAAERALDLSFQESPGDYGIGVGFHFDEDVSFVVASAGTGNLTRALDMLAFALRSYDVDWPSPKFQTTTAPYLRKLESDPTVKFDRVYQESLFKGHAYGRIATPDEIARVKATDIAAWLDRTINPRNAVLIIVGDVVPGDVEAIVRDSFSGWKAEGGVVGAPVSFGWAASRDGATASATPPLAAASAFQIVDRPGATQTVIRLGCLLPEGDARVDAVRDLAAWSVQDTLHRWLRHKSGSTYSLDAWASPYRTGGATLEVSTAVANAGLPRAVARLRSFWKTAAKGAAVGQDDLQAGQGALASHRLLSYEDSTSLVGSALQAWTMGWPLDAADRYADYLAAASLSEVNGVLATCSRGMTAALLGDEKVIRDALSSPPDEEAPALEDSLDDAGARPPSDLSPSLPPAPEVPAAPTPGGAAEPAAPAQVPASPPGTPATRPAPPATAPAAAPAANPTPTPTTLGPTTTPEPSAEPATSRPLFHPAPPAK